MNDDAIDFYDDATNIYQNINTTDGGTYTVDFNFAPRPGYDGTVNSIEVLVDGVVVKTITADGSSDTALNWQSDTITFTGDGTPARIEFRENGVDQNYGRGMMLDNIEITEDLPAGHANGMENEAILLPEITATTTDSDGSETLTLTITSIPEGAMLTDGTNTFTATAGNTDVDVTNWQLDGITITPPEEFSGEITLTVNATSNDGSSQNTTSSNINITVADDDDTFNGTATEDIYEGDVGTDTINGNAGNDWLSGGAGDDTINGGTGDDTLNGGEGNDTLYGSDNTESYSAQVLEHGPVAYLKLSDDTSTAIDETSNNHDAIYQGHSSSGATGAISTSTDTAASFDGSGDYVEIPASTDFQIPEGTITLWFNTSDLSSTQTLISRDSSSFDGGGHLNITLDTNGQIDVRHQTDSASHYVDSGVTTVNTGEWHQMSYSWGSDGMKLYIDDQLVDSDPTVLTLEGNNEPITIGASQWVSGDGVANNLQHYFEGQIDEVAIFDQALSLEEIQDLNEASQFIAEENTLNGGDGDDILVGGAGNDTLDGGSGTDTVNYSNADAAITVDLSDTSAQDTGSAGTDTITNIENVTGSNYDDNISGNGSDNILIGGEGNDTLSGGDGSDLFIFQEGNGADTINGGAGSSWTDTIELQDAMGGDDLGTYGTDWTITLTEGSIEETNSDNILFSDDADGTINLQDGSSIDFTDIERIDW